MGNEDCLHLHLTKLAGPAGRMSDGRAYKCVECKENLLVEIKPLEIKVTLGRAKGASDAK